MEMPEVSSLRDFFLVFLAAILAGLVLGLWYKVGTKIMPATATTGA